MMASLVGLRATFMMTLMPFVVFAGTFYVTSWFIEFWNGKKNKSGHERRLPPSLPSLPLVGSLPFITDLEALPEALTKIACKLGPVFSLRLGTRTVVVLNNRESIEDALVRHSSSFSGRAPFYMEQYSFNRDQRGIAFRNYDAEFKRYHKLVLSILKDFGFGSRSQLESQISLEVAELIKYFRKTNGKAFDPKELILLSASNVPINMLFGRRSDYKDGMMEMACHMKRYVDAIDPPVDLFPLLRFFPPHNKKISQLIDSITKLLSSMEKEIDSIMNDKDRDCLVRRYIEKEGSDYDRDQLHYTLRDFIGGSTDTTSTMILWFFIYIANNPQIEDRLQKEIDSVVPRDRLPTIDDHPRLPYVEATILELLRHKAPLPMAIPHLTLHDTEVLGYFIPADTVVLPNIKGAHTNRTDWPDSDVFRPERFLDENKKLINRNSVIAFSLGRRSCSGEALGRQQLFLFISGLMQNFHVRPPEDVKLITVKTIYSIMEAPSPFKIRMIARNG